jgi:hypothetical protein
MRNNLLRELKDLDGTIAGLQQRRVEVFEMLNTLTTLVGLYPNGRLGELRHSDRPSEG